MIWTNNLSIEGSPLKVVMGIVVVLLLMFIMVPLLALFLRITPGEFVDALSNPIVTEALTLSLMTALVSTIIVIIAGTPVAYLHARSHYPGKEVIDSVIDLPIVLPPAVAGIALLMAFGRYGLIGAYLNEVGLSIAFTTLAVIFAQIFVSCPFYIRQARAGFEAVDRSYEDASRTLGAGPAATFFLVSIPLSLPSLISGAVMTFSRALGEFGATIMVAGNFPGRTQTMPLAIYTAMQSDLNAALSLSIILVVISFGVIVIVKFFSGRGVYRC
ncbi:ABC transporter permease [Methanocalculus sp.]|uniref:ABC transporter permease n=1 Tax=Methanocalculus sp. TaxID=2004547 RepID=UPI00272157C2|nr:ABC transporter permease [Methanocalculus sp.]MDO8841203.1 ABC transporter permease [Methanocalculus sp.]